MRVWKAILPLFFLLTLTVSEVHAQGSFVQTVTSQSTNCNATCSVLDVNTLSNNPGILVFITPSGGTPNPHPVGAYYMYLHKWSIFDLDEAAITIGAKYTVEYTYADATHFLYVVPQRVSPKDIPYIDHPGLNGNPNVLIQITPHITPTIGNHWNHDAVKVEYDRAASKWFIANINNTPVPSDSAYNIRFTYAVTVANPKAGLELGPNVATPIPQDCHCPIPTSLPPNGSAGGDLRGTYPNPSVQQLQGKPVSNAQPTLGQVLRWGVAGWEPADQPTSPIPIKPSVLYFNQSGRVDMKTPNINTVPIVGLNDQSFTLAQSSRIVFHTTITAQDAHSDGLGNGNGTVNIWVLVEILNASNNVIARAIAYTRLASMHLQTMNSVGIGMLPAGTYHTRVSLHRVGPDEIETYSSSSEIQGGQMIIEIFPD